ncbi:bifunctional glyoxylate/hydroxypyruvate reductase B [Paenibacillus sp. 598K]|uniref:2-hydroxyacid dehydrogenase n=1 Tax=Paenibacillus sp. 598K TaxID=1117987 RepID=UPI000FFAFDB4|nr:D-glycerate dehydrogenase [Paenibacillus sp. 598K]GBF72691.1 bifunctional glyoxylate/hydroxypyruvate reductase B [Paenibacillus sp. 598K]
MKPKVYVATSLPQQAIAYLEEHCEVSRWTGDRGITKEAFIEEAAEAEGVLLTGTTIDESLLARLPHLRVVSNMSVGYNNFDLQAMRARGILGTHTPYVLDDTVADLVFALILSVSRRIAELDRFVRAGHWVKGSAADLFGTDVHHRTLGIIGMGRIGEAIAARGRLGFGMDVIYHNRSRKPDVEDRLGLRYVELDELLAEADFVVLMTPLTPQTQGYIGKEAFARMKSSAFFINASRGQTVDEAALVEALQTGQIAGAGLDVFEQEPIPPDHPLLQMEQVVLVPHIGSATAETRFEMAMLAARNLVHALRGDGEVHIVKELQP